MNQKFFPYLKNLRIALMTAIVIVLVFGITDIVQNKTNTIEVIAMLVLLLNLIYLISVTPKLPPPSI